MCVSVHARCVVVGAAWEEQRSKKENMKRTTFYSTIRPKKNKNTNQIENPAVEYVMCLSLVDSNSFVVASVIFEYSTTLINKVVITCCFEPARSYITQTHN